MTKGIFSHQSAVLDDGGVVAGFAKQPRALRFERDRMHFDDEVRTIVPEDALGTVQDVHFAAVDIHLDDLWSGPSLPIDEVVERRGSVVATSTQTELMNGNGASEVGVARDRRLQLACVSRVGLEAVNSSRPREARKGECVIAIRRADVATDVTGADETFQPP